MDYLKLFNVVRNHVESLGVECEMKPGEPITDAMIQRAELGLGMPIPVDLKKFYQDIGNGLFFRYVNEDDENAPFTNLEFPKMSELPYKLTDQRDFINEFEGYEYQYTDDPDLAKRTAKRMLNWLPLLDEGNGDTYCIDLGHPGHPVVYNSHDWVGRTGENGHIMAANWQEYLIAWGSVCFQFPKSMYWPECYIPDGGINWVDAEQFREPYRIPTIRELI